MTKTYRMVLCLPAKYQRGIDIGMAVPSFVIVCCDARTDRLSEVYQMFGRSNRRKNVSMGVALGISHGSLSYKNVEAALRANDNLSGSNAIMTLKIMYQLYDKQNPSD